MFLRLARVAAAVAAGAGLLLTGPGWAQAVAQTDVTHQDYSTVDGKNARCTWREYSGPGDVYSVRVYADAQIRWGSGTGKSFWQARNAAGSELAHGYFNYVGTGSGHYQYNSDPHLSTSTAILFVTLVSASNGKQTACVMGN